MAVACIAATQTHKRSLGRVCEHSSCSMPACSTLLRVRAEARGWYRQGGGGASAGTSQLVSAALQHICMEWTLHHLVLLEGSAITGV